MEASPLDARKRRFELPGSRPHHPPLNDFEIKHLHLKIEPDLIARSVAGVANITVRALADIDTVELDAVNLRVSSVEDADARKLSYRTFNDRLAITLGSKLDRNKFVSLAVTYTANPQKGFYFIGNDKAYPNKRTEAWTQGQTNEASHWFPVIDHPQAKFTVELDIVAQSELDVIANGVKISELVRSSDQKKIHKWSMRHPIPPYLVSIVIGKYDMHSERDNLLFYVPKGTAVEVRERTFARTADMIHFFERYFDIPYPYDKYSQVTVQDFLAQGMENASCTTLTVETLHDKRVEIDYPSEDLASHEIAHQWFGDLVTCRDWQDLWLNESFATYCESLYREYWKGKDDYYHLILENADSYFEEAGSRYTRPIVTNVYKHPDDLFDTHSYAKGSCVIHMLRHLLGDQDFKDAIRTYLKTHAHDIVETQNLVVVLEKQSQKNLREFFEQWIFKAGHPELKVAFSQDNDTARVQISQVQEGSLFDFDLAIRVAFQDEEKIFNIHMSGKENILLIPIKGKVIQWFSVNPELGVLANIISTHAPEQLLVNQLKRGITIVERIYAARALANHPTPMAVQALKETTLCDEFWLVKVEAAKSLGAKKQEFAYDTLKSCINRVRDPRVKRAVVGALGEFRRKELVEFLKPILLSNSESYAVQSEAYTAIGKTKTPEVFETLRQVIEGEETYLDLAARGAIAGLKEFAEKQGVADFLLGLSAYGKRQKIREAATSALEAFASSDRRVAEHLRTHLLHDKWFKVRKNACTALSKAKITDAISDLKWVAENDIDAGVRRRADECLVDLEEELIASKRRALPTLPPEAIALEEELRKKRQKHLEYLSRVDNYEIRDR